MRIITRIQMLFFMLFSAGAAAQDMHFTQFYSSPLFLSPAFAGADVCSRVSLTYRNQWPGIQKTYRSYLFSVDHYFIGQNIGAGILFGSDVSGSGDLKTTIVNIPVAYEAKLTKRINVRLGLQPGIHMRSINYDKLLFGDQIARGGGVATIEAPVVKTTFFDAGAGLLFYSRKYWGGFSAYHLNKPTQSLRGEPDAIVPIKIGFHGGGKFLLNEEEKEEKNRRFISPALNYRHQNKFDQLDLGFYFTQNVFNVGFWYRGIPLFKSYAPGYANNDAVAIIVGIRNDRFNFGYSYDMTISKLSTISNGAHEITVSYQLCKLRKKKKVRMLTPCPKF
ncbi:MAG: type IX secretion system membrane protein PorP/SprF [Bacteroidetes bacterium]|nr:type IX secretion system membrane protein PorP/SprF [Bacteroidota bacterium]